MKLFKSPGSSWGPGKVHALGHIGEKEEAYCVAHSWNQRIIYGHPIDGDEDMITCRRCIKMLGLAAKV